MTALQVLQAPQVKFQKTSQSWAMPVLQVNEVHKVSQVSPANQVHEVQWAPQVNAVLSAKPVDQVPRVNQASAKPVHEVLQAEMLHQCK